MSVQMKRQCWGCGRVDDFPGDIVKDDKLDPDLLARVRAAGLDDWERLYHGGCGPILPMTPLWKPSPEPI